MFDAAATAGVFDAVAISPAVPNVPPLTVGAA
jgi:hypothetical protein